METEKKWIFDRLLEYWKERSSQETYENIGFWKEPQSKRMYFAETGAMDVLIREDTKRNFWEETAEYERKTEGEDSAEAPTEKIAEGFKGAAEGIFGNLFSDKEPDAEKPMGDQFDRSLLAEMQAEERISKSFLMNEEQEPDKSIIHVKEVQEEKRIEKVSGAEDAETAADIETLMRQITKRLWEEREGCGRRLR